MMRNKHRHSPHPAPSTKVLHLCLRFRVRLACGLLSAACTRLSRPQELGRTLFMASSSRNGAMMQTFAVTVPPGIGPGQQFQASLDGQLTMVIVPHGSGPNSTLHVQIPVRPSSVQKYAVTIPNNVQPGGRFQANLGGQLVWLHCPRNLGPGKQMLVDANSASPSNGNSAKSWPPPIAVPDKLDGARLLCV